MGHGQGQQLEERKGQAWFSVAVVIWFEGAVTRHAQVLGLLLSQLGQLHVQLAQMSFSYCFVQLGRNTGRHGIRTMLWNPDLQPAASRGKNCSAGVCAVCYTYYLILSSVSLSRCVGFDCPHPPDGAMLHPPLQVTLGGPSITFPFSPSTNPRS